MTCVLKMQIYIICNWFHSLAAVISTGYTSNTKQVFTHIHKIGRAIRQANYHLWSKFPSSKKSSWAKYLFGCKKWITNNYYNKNVINNNNWLYIINKLTEEVNYAIVSSTICQYNGCSVLITRGHIGRQIKRYINEFPHTTTGNSQIKFIIVTFKSSFRYALCWYW